MKSEQGSPWQWFTQILHFQRGYQFGNIAVECVLYCHVPSLLHNRVTKCSWTQYSGRCGAREKHVSVASFVFFVFMIPQWNKMWFLMLQWEEDSDKDSQNSSIVCFCTVLKRLQNSQGTLSCLSSSHCTCPHTTWPTGLECHPAYLCNVWGLRHY